MVALWLPSIDLQAHLSIIRYVDSFLYQGITLTNQILSF
ncbi:hypothetical protein VPMS16_333 [Vibrio sp. 16]|nr:hypothetical protein VPMS16_333 [Vibrio sp. 16]